MTIRISWSRTSGIDAKSFKLNFIRAQSIPLPQAPVYIYTNCPTNTQYNEVKSFMYKHSYLYASIFSQDIFTYNKCLHYHVVEIDETSYSFKIKNDSTPLSNTWISFFWNIIETETKVLDHNELQTNWGQIYLK